MSTPIEEVVLTDIRETFSGLRLSTPQAQAVMPRSLVRHGQISPLVCRRDQQGIDLIDGFKRLRGCRSLQWPRVQVRVLDTTTCCGKVEMIRLNRISRSITSIEEALIVHSLHRDDGWSLPDIALVVGRPQRWVTNRCSLAEGLHPQVRDHLFRGAINAGIAWELAHLPRETQERCLPRVMKYRLSQREVESILRQASPRNAVSLMSTPWHVLDADAPLPAPSRQNWYRRLAGLHHRQQELLAGAVEDLLPDSERDDQLLREALFTMDQLRSFLERQRHDQAAEILF